MTSREALTLIKEQFISDMESLDTDSNWTEKDKEADINWWKEKFQIIEKDLEIVEIIKQKAKGNRFFKGCLLRMFQENGEKKTYLDNPPRKIDKNYYKIKEWLENDR